MSRIERIRVEDLAPGVWRTRVMIRFGQCDPAGIVYTPNYFDIFNSVVEDWYPAALGLDYHALIRERRLGVGYAHASADFLIPGFMGEHLDVAVVVANIGRASFGLTLHAMKGEDEAVRGRFVVVTTSLDAHKAVPIPADLKAALEAYQDRCR